MPPTTLRTLADTLGLSRTTVSDALRGSPRVNIETVRRVCAAAVTAGYEPNPLTGAVMSHLRRSHGQQFHGVLAALEIVEPDQAPHATRYNQAVLKGVSDRAAALGFKMERFELGTGGLSLSRLDTILHTRNIRGLVLLPSPGMPDLSGLTWSRYTAVYADLFINHPPLHCVCVNHYRAMQTVLRELHARGYRRPGLFIETPQDARLEYCWEGGFLAMRQYLADLTEVPVLHTPKLSRGEFQAWFRKYKPDAVLGHFPEAIKWMRSCGARLPAKHGFVCLNQLRAVEPCAALDFQPGRIGARAAELVIDQLLHNEFGIPVQPSLTTIPAHLVEGPTLRAALPAQASAAR